MAYQPLPHDSVAPPPSGILPNTSPESVAVWTIDVDAGSGQRHGHAVMAGNSVPPAPLHCEQPPTLSGELWVGGTLTGTKAIYSGGMPPVTVQSQFQVSSAATGQPWSGVDAWGSEDSGTHTVGANEVGKYFRVAGRGIDQSDDAISQAETLMSFSEVIGPVAAPLIVGDPTLTGEAIVGYTLTCSEPSIEGGSGDFTINYYWQDADSKRVLYMGGTWVVSANDLGRNMCCSVYVADNKTGENTQVTSTNCLGPVSRPALPEFEVYVDGELHDDPTADVGVEPNGMVVIEARPQAVAYPPLDLTYSWQIRTGTGRLSGDLDAAGIIYLAPEAAPAGALVTCTAMSDDANDNGYAAEVTILVSE